MPPTRLLTASTVLNRAAARITALTGTGWTALAFLILACVSLPAVILTGNVVIIVAWITQSLLQLVLLPIIIVGQNEQGKAAEDRSVRTLEDVEKLLTFQSAEIATEHQKTRDHVTAALTNAVEG